jgi:hypothetical protein
MTTTTEATRTFSVALEGVVYKLVDVHEGHDARFEQRYENDHFYAGGTLAPHVLSGRRWHASKALRESRFVAAACPLPDPHAGTNLATYFLTAGGLRHFYDAAAAIRQGGCAFRIWRVREGSRVLCGPTTRPSPQADRAPFRRDGCPADCMSVITVMGRARAGIDWPVADRRACRCPGTSRRKGPNSDE